MLDVLYGAVAGARRTWFERHPEARHRLRQPVISVGNLSVGGTGKTPLVAQIAEWLIATGQQPAILSRGYKRQFVSDGVEVVSEGSGTLTDVDHAGDEPFMLAQHVPQAIVCVSEDRYLAGVIAERVLGATVHVLDDGFQHVQLRRDYDILVTSPGEIGSGHALPRGRLREGKDAAARAHFVVVVGGDTAVARSEAWDLGISGFSAAQRRLDFSGEAATAVADTSGVIAVAGIARPEQFFALLHDAGVAVKHAMPFADHHPYSSADVARIAAALELARAHTVVTTAKDAVRFERLGKLPFALTVVPMCLHIEDWASLVASLNDVLERARVAA